MNKFIAFLKQSNRYKHLIGGMLVGVQADTVDVVPEAVAGLNRLF